MMAAALATAGSAACSWAHPGVNPYRGDPGAALVDFTMPDETRRRLRARLAAHQYTDVVTITRDAISSPSTSYTDLRDMHSGHGVVCHGAVDRSAWDAKRKERGLVYCDGDTCVILPTICNNVSLVTRKQAGTRPVVGEAAPDDPLEFDPPAAGRPLAAAPDGTTPGATDSGSGNDGNTESGNAFAAGSSQPTTGSSALAPTSTTAGVTIPPSGSDPISPVSAVPETPTAWLLLAGLGLLGAVGRARLRSMRS